MKIYPRGSDFFIDLSAAPPSVVSEILRGQEETAEAVGPRHSEAWSRYCEQFHLQRYTRRYRLAGDSQHRRRMT